jgi:hypothetical protein
MTSNPATAEWRASPSPPGGGGHRRGFFCRAIGLADATGLVPPAPACNAQAIYCDIDHTVPYPDGPTCECNTTPKCRRHHRTKQAPGWKIAQPTPDTSTWTTPSGRTHTTAPTAYDL